ncbi:DUF6716 putative glycosyltransferase [Demequina soli]|uniref:DUF6716 putative glycosyltransferase n=1 Tax=Demequina soli TaxID=1638987 RepID=UPI00078254D9|nr:DUF6716 putative glycosyltransferase [Demequina soli]
MTEAAPPISLLVVADSDSYLKWAVSRLLEAPSSWRTELLVVRNAVTPSAEQITAAVDGRLEHEPAVVSFDALEARLRAERPDVLLLACRGPLIQLLVEERFGGVPPCKVAVAGIPGIWLPPTELGVTLRASVDMLVVHSVRERAAVATMLPRGRIREVGLASLVDDRAVGGGERPRVIFAPQALVPHDVDHRRALLAGLVAAAHANPQLDWIIKLRGTEGEAQTHAEHASFPALARDIPAAGWPANLRFAHGPLRDYLGDCAGFVTVSSTAALEAIAAGVPVICLDDFGVDAGAINVVFEGSRLFGSLTDLARLGFRDPDPAWCHDNYFHPADESDWIARAEAMARDGGTATLAGYRAPRGGMRGAARRARRRHEALGSADTPLRHLVASTAAGAVRALHRAREGRGA